MWWRLYPPEARRPREPGPDDRPELAPGARVRLVGRPERARRVLYSEWHRYRYRYVYIVETSSSWTAYWFREQLVLEP